jgi:2-iminobutanoate/2-iminopropanoate deaminase
VAPASTSCGSIGRGATAKTSTTYVEPTAESATSSTRSEPLPPTPAPTAPAVKPRYDELKHEAETARRTWSAVDWNVTTGLWLACGRNVANMSDAVHLGLDPVGVPVAVGGFSQAAVVPAGCEVIFASGQVPEDLDGSVPEDFADQARLAWRNVERTLAAGGFTLDHLVKVSMYIRDRSYRVANREVRHAVLGDRRPALTVLVTDHWDERWLIEIEAVAARRPD